jgi:pimeloyl-ACP methyl ester carboxylesterase
MDLAHDRRGSGPTVLLVHPLGADRHVWDPVLNRLAAEREVLAVDVPGFGGSAPLAGTPTPPALAAALASFLAEQGIDRPHVVGNSHGGWLALELALNGRARSVTAIAPAGLWSAPLTPKHGAARRVARLASPLLPRLTASARGRRVLLAASVAHPERVPAADALHLVRAYAAAPGFRAANDAMRASRFAQLADIRVPLVLAWPEFDRLISRPSALPPNARNVTLRGCGHIPTWDDPEQVAELVLAATAPRAVGVV